MPSSFDLYVQVECVCPICGAVGERTLERDYIDRPHVWRRGGYIVRTCVACEIARDYHFKAFLQRRVDERIED